MRLSTRYSAEPYSCAWIDEAQEAVRIKSKLADYGGDAEAQRRDQAATAQLLHAFGMECGKASMMFLDVAEVVNDATGAEHTPAAFVSDPMEGTRQ